MPIYQYRCQECDHELEVLQSLQEPPRVDCPKGHAGALEKCISAPSFRFSGGGYYETDEKPKAKQRNVVKPCDATTASSAGKSE